MTKTSIFTIAGFTAIAFLVSACETAVDRTGAYATEETPQAQATAKGVRVTTRAERWPGASYVHEKVTPLVVSVVNNGPVPVDVRYSQLTLTMPDGERYSALPPFRVTVTSRGPAVDASIEPITQPGFEHYGFKVAPYYRLIYPELETYQNVFAYNSPYFSRKYPYWENTGLPTEEMLQRALPEGVVYPGGRLQGWVFFEKVPETADIAVLHTRFHDSDTGRKFVGMQIPLDMKQPR